MDPFADLRALYPWLPRPSCGPGWHAVIEAFCERVVEVLPPWELHALVIMEVGENAGRLRIRVEPRGRFAGVITALVREAEQTAETVCCQCGGPGHLAERGGWTAVLCDEHQGQGLWL